jgi:large subunit ribosomal protein L14e
VPLPAIEIGRICVKTAGREAGKKCVIVDIVDKNFVVVTGPEKVTEVKRRRVNVKHLEPLEDKIDIVKGASDAEVSEVLKKSGKIQVLAKPILK